MIWYSPMAIAHRIRIDVISILSWKSWWTKMKGTQIQNSDPWLLKKFFRHAIKSALPALYKWTGGKPCQHSSWQSHPVNPEDRMTYWKYTLRKLQKTIRKRCRFFMKGPIQPFTDSLFPFWKTDMMPRMWPMILMCRYGRQRWAIRRQVNRLPGYLRSRGIWRGCAWESRNGRFL